MTTGIALTFEQTLVTTSCCACGIVFAVPDWWDKARREKHDDFFCPNGHSLTYTGETEQEKKIKRLGRELANAEEDARIQRAEAVAAKRKATNERRARSRIENRAKAGVCPCCQRSFVQMQRHMATKHPDFVPADA